MMENGHELNAPFPTQTRGADKEIELEKNKERF